MAVGNGDFPSIAQVDGLRLGVAEAGIKYSNRKDGYTDLWMDEEFVMALLLRVFLH